MDYSYCIDDIALATTYLEDSKLLDSIDKNSPVCDVYSLPSHNHQAFYTQIYKSENDYVLVFAKSYFATPIGLECVMYSFQDAQKADEHIGYKGDVYCGICRVPLNDTTLTTLLSVLPQVEEFADDSAIRIDGTTTIIRRYCETGLVSLGYHDISEITNNTYTEAQRSFLDALSIYIERIIGNLLVSSGKMSSNIFAYE